MAVGPATPEYLKWLGVGGGGSSVCTLVREGERDVGLDERWRGFKFQMLVTFSTVLRLPALLTHSCFVAATGDGGILQVRTLRDRRQGGLPCHAPPTPWSTSALSYAMPRP
jgi:hypothetical protein